MARDFCTDIAMALGEPHEGTGALAERHLLVNWPKGKWRRPRFEAEGFAPELQSAMRAASGAGRYVGLCDDPTPHPCSWSPSPMATPSCPPPRPKPPR